MSKKDIFKSIFDSIGQNSQAEILKKTIQYLHLADLQGDYVEFGVFRGETFITAYHFSQIENKKYLQENKLTNMHFYVFDSFKGMPKPNRDDATGFIQDDFHEGAYSCDEATFKMNLSNNGVDLNKVHIVNGFYKDTLNQETKSKLPLKTAALVYIDCDLYESTKQALDFLTDYLVDGSIIIFDDWFTFRGNPEKGEQRAFREWLHSNSSTIKVSEFHKFGWHGNSFIIHK